MSPIFSGDEDFKHHSLPPGGFTYWTRHLQKESLQAHWKGPYQVPLTNPCVAKLQGIDSWIHVSHLKKTPNPGWTCTQTGDLKIKIFRNWSGHSLWRRQLSQHNQTRPVYLFSLLLLTLFSPSLYWKDNTLICISQSPEKGGNLSDCWICHQKLWSVHGVGDPLVLPVTNFSLVPNATVSYTHKPTGVNYLVRLLHPGVPTPCFKHSPTITILAQLNTSTSALFFLFKYDPLPCTQGKCKQANSSFQGF